MSLTRSLGAPVIRLGAVTSTMDIARRMEQLGAAEGTTVVASSQSQGRGRADRSWQSPKGAGFYCSVLLRPRLGMERFRSFSVAAGLAICDALDPNHDIGLQLKWPNDILYRDRKLAGILMTTSLTGNTISSAVLGIGLNLWPNPAQPDTAVALTEISGVPQALLDCPESLIKSELSDRYRALCGDGIGAVLADWPQRLAYRDQEVTIQDGETHLRGIIEGLDLAGALILATDRGTQVISSGELTRGPRPV